MNAVYTSRSTRHGHGFFNLVASGLAGLPWDRFGASSSFHAGAAFSIAALLAILLRVGKTGTA